MKEAKKLIIWFLAFISLFGTLSVYLESKMLIIIVCFLVLIVSFALFKKRIGKEFVIALLMALVITSYYVYEYASNNIFIGRINLFPLVAWTTGLVVLWEIYSSIKIKHKYLIISLAYIALMILVEYVGYYILGIRLNWDYSSFFGIGILHGPLFMQLFYLLAGPIYLMVSEIVESK